MDAAPFAFRAIVTFVDATFATFPAATIAPFAAPAVVDTMEFVRRVILSRE
jgi:hypothetical protein